MSRKITMSLAEWMNNNLGENAIEKYWSDKNELNPLDIGYGSSKRIWIKCQETIYHEDYDISASNFTSGKRCPYCSRKRIHPKDSFAQWCIKNVDEYFLEKYWSDRNTLSPWEINRGSDSIKVYIKCQDKDYHEDYPISPNNFTNPHNLSRCPYCYKKKNGKIHYNDSLGALYPKSVELWSDKNKKPPFKYTPLSHLSVYWKCENNLHEDYIRVISGSNVSEFRCPKCSQERKESFLQEKVRLFVTEELNFSILHEYDCTLKCINPKTYYILPYDNEVIINEEYRLIIEVHGEQHYINTTWIKTSAKKNGTTPQEELGYLQWKDALKKEFALSQGYHYLELPYWTDNNQEEWKTLILEKLNNLTWF